MNEGGYNNLRGYEYVYAACADASEHIGHATPNKKRAIFEACVFGATPPFACNVRPRVASAFRRRFKGSDCAMALKIRFSHEVFHIARLTSQSINHMGRPSLALMPFAFELGRLWRSTCEARRLGQLAGKTMHLEQLAHEARLLRRLTVEASHPG